MKRQMAFLTLIMLMITGAITAASANTQKDVAALSPSAIAEAVLVNWEYDQLAPAVAFHETSNQYVVVWEDHHWGFGADWDIYGRRVTAEGAPIGNLFGISWEESNQRLAPDVAANPLEEEFLAVWQYAYTPTDHDIYARRFGTDGTLIGNEFAIANEVVMESNPVVAYDSHTNHYLVVWEQLMGSDEFTHHNIYGRIVTADGVLVEFVPIAEGALDEAAPAVAYNPVSGQYLVVWQAKQAGTGDYNLIGQRISAIGNLVGVPISISTWEYDQVAPRVAADGQSGQYLVVWEDHHWAWGAARDIYGQRIAADGTLSGGNFGISWDGDRERTHPDVAWHSAAGEYAVTYELAYTAADHDIYRRRIGSNGVLLEEEHLVVSLTSSEHYPAIAADHNDRYLVAWEDERALATTNIDLYVSTIAVPRLSGHVYEGVPTSQTIPLADATVKLGCASNSTAFGTLLDTAVTAADGSYSLRAGGYCAYYNIVVDDYPAHNPAGAQSVGGAVMTNQQIQYTAPLDGKVWSDNNFWYDYTGLRPDLVVTDVWSEGSKICYQLLNDGAAAVPASHITSLSVDGVQRAELVYPAVLAPQGRDDLCFNYTWACSGADEISVTADFTQIVLEEDETNNNRTETWQCEVLPPEFVSGPAVQNIGSTTATVVWVTSDESRGEVWYGTEAERYDQMVAADEWLNQQIVTLTGLAPMTTYQLKVRAIDAHDNVIESPALTFTTRPLSDNTNPLITLADPGLLRGVVTLTASASDDQGVERVEFYLNGQLIGSDYSWPYQFEFDSEPFENGTYTLLAKVVDWSGRFMTDDLIVNLSNLRDVRDPSVVITAPAAGATVSGKVNVTAALSDDTGLMQAYFRVDGAWESFKPLPSNPKTATVTFEWDTSTLTYGMHTIEVEVYDIDQPYMRFASAAQQVLVVAPTPPNPPQLKVSHNIVRYGNYVAVNLSVWNVGGETARNIEIHDYVRGFQPISTTEQLPTPATYTTTYDSYKKEWLMHITGVLDIPALSSRTLTYFAVPVMYDQNEPAASIGYMTGLHYDEDPQGLRIHKWFAVPTPQAMSGGELKTIAQAHAEAIEASDYVLVTNPQRLFTYGYPHIDEVQMLLSDMAKLARARNGVLGFLTTYDRAILRGLLGGTGAWGLRVQPATSLQSLLSSGVDYVLLVGEMEIIPTWTAWYNSVHFSDQPYAGSGSPQRVVGRIVGNDPMALRRPIAASLAGHFDRSNAFMVSGTGDGTSKFVDCTNDMASILAKKNVNVDTLHLSHYNTDALRLTEFRNRITDSDIITFRNHGAVDAWDSISTNDIGTVNLGNTEPFVFALACLSGNFEDHPSYVTWWGGNDDYHIVEAFFDEGAAVYIGSTETSGRSSNNAAGRYFYKTWGTDESAAKAFTDMERDLWSGFSYWATEYNIYGDVKFGATSTARSAAETVLDVPTPILEIAVPDYEVTTHGDVDYVMFPDSGLLLEVGVPELPYYLVQYTYAPGVRVQDVVLISRSEPELACPTGGMDVNETAEGCYLNLPLTNQECGGLPVYTAPPTFITHAAVAEHTSGTAGWLPGATHDWTITENEDGTTTLTLRLFALEYNPLTTSAKFYPHYTFEVLFEEAAVAITQLETDAAVYAPGENVGAEMRLEVGGDPQDVTVSAVVKAAGSEEVVDGLLLSTLTEAQGAVGFAPQWDSTGAAPGLYVVEVTVWDAVGHVQDRQAALIEVSEGATLYLPVLVKP